MIRISVRQDYQRLGQRLDAFERRQLPFATALGLTRVAQRVRGDLKSTMESAFDRPTPFTLNSVAVRPATKTKLESSVFFKEWAPKGVPAGRYLRPQIDGGPRGNKGAERKLRAAGVLPAGYYLLPAKGAQRDGFGNVHRGQLVKVMSAVRALSTAGSSGNRNGRGRGKRRAESYFVIKPGARNGLPPGIYRRTPQGGHILVFIFARQPTYGARFPFWEKARSAGESHMRREMSLALADALRKARR